MTELDIPEDVRQLILESLDSVAQLEALLLLRGDPAQGWAVESVGRRLYISPAVAEAVLNHLRDRGFCTVRNDEGSLYHYAPRSIELKRRVDQLAETYKHRLIVVTNLIHSKPDPSIQRFADAFRLRKDG